MFLGYQENNGIEFIASVANAREELENNKFMKFTKIEETQDKYKLVDGVYITVAEAFEKEKKAKREEINAARDAAEQGGFEYMGKTFDSDPISCQRISTAAQAMAFAPEESAIVWTCQDNTTISLNKTQLSGLVAALAQWSNTCHQKATALKAEVEKAQTKEELDKITW